MIGTTTKRKRKGSISEEDISLLLQRYTATTILALLQEVAQFSDVKIDWNSLVKKTSTGISNAREYQMLWRHLAYSHTLAEKFDDGDVPLDDDSDLEHDLEAFPPVNSETSTEAAACVKVLLASGLLSDSVTPSHSTVEAPLTINVPNSHAFRTLENVQLAYPTQGTNITVPVSVQIQPLPPVTTAEGLSGNGSASGAVPVRRKRNKWMAEEEMDLIAAVQKYGEGNWANILKGDFKGDRTASQLSKRWTIIKKRQANLNLGAFRNSTGSQLSEAQLAARRAVSLALDMPLMNSLSTACSFAATLTIPPSSSSTPPAPVEASLASSTSMDASTKSAVGSISSQAQQQSQQPPYQTAGSLQTGTISTTPRSRVTTNKTSLTAVKSSLGPNLMVQAAAVAAGARIATPSTAASLLKAAKSKNAVHIRPGEGSLVKPSMAGGTKPLTTNHTGPQSSYQYTQAGQASPPPGSYSGAMPSVPRPCSSHQAQGKYVKPAAPTEQLPPANGALSPNLSAHQTSIAVTPCVTAEGRSKGATSTMGAGLLSKEEVKSSEEMKAVELGNVPEVCVEYDQATLPNSEAVGEN